MTAQTMRRRIHVIATAWSLACAAYLIAMVPHQVGVLGMAGTREANKFLFGVTLGTLGTTFLV